MGSRVLGSASAGSSANPWALSSYHATQGQTCGLGFLPRLTPAWPPPSTPPRGGRAPQAALTAGRLFWNAWDSIPLREALPLGDSSQRLFISGWVRLDGLSLRAWYPQDADKAGDGHTRVASHPDAHKHGPPRHVSRGADFCHCFYMKKQAQLKEPARGPPLGYSRAQV